VEYPIRFELDSLDWQSPDYCLWPRDHCSAMTRWKRPLEASESLELPDSLDSSSGGRLLASCEAAGAVGTVICSEVIGEVLV